MQDYTKTTDLKPKPKPAVPRDELSFEHPPRGVTMERTPEGGLVVTSPIFSGSTVLFIVFAVFWNAIASVFVYATIMQTLAHFGFDVSAPTVEWEGGGSPALWQQWLFLSPFILVGFGTAFFALRGIFGKFTLAVEHDAASIVTRFGPFGKPKIFHPQSVKRIGRYVAYTQNKSPVYHLMIEMNNGRQIKFPGFTKVREKWMGLALGVVLGKTVEGE